MTQRSTAPDARTRSGGLQAVFSLSAASAIAAGVAFIANVLAARQLGPELRGHVAFALQLAYFVAPVLILAGDRATLRGDRTYFRPSLRFLVVASVAAAAVMLLVFRDSRAIAAAIAFVTAWFLLRRSDAVLNRSFKPYVLPFLGYQATILLVSLALFLLEVSEWTWWAAAYAAPAVALAFFKPTVTEDPTDLKRASKNLPLVGASLSQMFSTRGQRLLLPGLANPAELGLFTVVATATEPLYWMAQALADHRSDAARKQPASTRARLVILARDAALFVPIAAIAAIALWFLLVPVFGESFEPARSFIVPLAVASVLLAAYRQTSAWLLAGASPGLVGKLELSTALVGLVVYVPSILLWQGVGAAWGSGAVYTVGTSLGLWLCARAGRSR